MINFRGIPTSNYSGQNGDSVASRGAVNFKVCGIDRLGQIQPSGFWLEELVHHAASTAHHKNVPCRKGAEESRGENVSHHFILEVLKWKPH